MGIFRKLKRLLIPFAIMLNVLGVWVSWEAVVKPLKDCHPMAWSRTFPAPFYLWEAPIWFWHDLYITLVLIGTLILSSYAVGEEPPHS